MDHSVRAYLKRIPISKLNALFEDSSFEDTYATNDAILRDVLEVLIARSTEPGSERSASIYRMQALQSKRKQPEHFASAKQ